MKLASLFSLFFSPERIASAYELLGGTFLDEHHDSQKALQYWRAACDERERAGLSKQIQVKYQTICFQVSLFLPPGMYIIWLVVSIISNGMFIIWLVVSSISDGMFIISLGVYYSWGISYSSRGALSSLQKFIKIQYTLYPVAEEAVPICFRVHLKS